MRKEIKIKNHVAELEHVAAFVEEIGEELGLDMEMQMNLNLVMEEMVSNVIFYAYPEGAEATIELKAESDGNGRYGHLHREEYHEPGQLSAS